MVWHNESTDDALKELSSSRTGLSGGDAEARLAKYGPNELRARKQVNPWQLLLVQFKNVLILTLVAATILSAFLGHGVEAVAIAVIIVFAAILGFIQEFKAEKAIEALKTMAAPEARVVRDGQEMMVPASLVVPGDILILAAGDRVPADARLLEASNLRIEESALTGESVPTEKRAKVTFDEDTPVGDRKNMIFAGTSVSAGRGKAITAATGMNTEFGKIAGMLEQVETERTPLQKNLDRVGVLLTRAAIAIVVFIIGLGLFRGQPVAELVIFGIALAVAVVPEALPAVVTISLALGVQRMVKRHALMRRLPAVETLGSTTVICSDKTGTLTRDQMTIRAIYLNGTLMDVEGEGYDPAGKIQIPQDDPKLSALLGDLLKAGILCNDAQLSRDENGEWDITGDPTEGALVVLGRKAQMEETKYRGDYPRIDEMPFSSEKKRMITIHTVENGAQAYMKGAPEIVVPRCSRIRTGAGVEELDQAGKEKVLEQASTLASRAMRLIALAEKKTDRIEDADDDLVLLGLVGMIDPPRAEAKSAVAKCRQAGIKPMMITGDHPVTAQAIARELGILTSGRSLTGAELQKIDDEELLESVTELEVFARVAPEHKLRIVDSLQKRGNVVAMTGDGVNDAPALKKADIGIAMGISGTAVSREASDMILTDDNFASIVSAVEEGRGIYENIRKYIAFMLSLNVGELLLLSIAALLNMPTPLSTLQILYVNFAVEGLPAMALAVDPISTLLMRRPPRNPKQGIFTPPLTILIAVAAIWSAVVNIGVYVWRLREGDPVAHAMALCFLSLVIIQFAKVFSFRTKDRSLFTTNPFANKWLNGALLIEIVLLGFILTVGPLRNIFGTYDVTHTEWLVLILSALTVIPVLEITKWVLRRTFKESGQIEHPGR